MKREIFDKYANAIAVKFIRISYIQKFMEENGHIVTHSTIIHGYNKAKESIDNDQDYAEVVNMIKNV